MKKVRRSQDSLSINSCTELSKTQLFLVSIVNLEPKINTANINIFMQAMNIILKYPIEIICQL